ncbi:MAG TPA: protein-glutamine gamma-glutamyltransferase [Clostridiales bacterium]|nr:protein-glutamine gamma-glutamyltransferase [Clostridiales bacterium]
MIIISNRLITDFQNGYNEHTVQAQILKLMMEGREEFRYPSLQVLEFELNLRNLIVEAAVKLAHSGLRFLIFRESVCNEQYWQRTSEGGFVLREGVMPSEAIKDIYKNGHLYGTECATAMVIVYYKALLEIYGEQLFNRSFVRIHLMNWHYLDPKLREIGQIHKTSTFLPGDRVYFTNPDVDPKTPELQGENAIDLGGGLYYGHGVGIARAEAIINMLNQNRMPGATRSAYFMDVAARPDFTKLYNIMH